MKQTIKQQQIGGLIQKEFSHVLRQEGNLIYSNALVTVTQVRMSADMGIAYVYLSIYNCPDKEVVLRGIEVNASRLRGGLSRRISSQMRRMPMLKFFIDDTLDEIENVDRIFAQLGRPEDEAQDEDEETDEEAVD